LQLLDTNGQGDRSPCKPSLNDGRDGAVKTYEPETIMTNNAPKTADTDLVGTRWQLDPKRSSVEFHVRHFWGLMTVKGHFDRYAGFLALGSDPAVDLKIEADSLDTGNDKRDTHLRSGDFFDVDTYPDVECISDRVVLEGERLHVDGRLQAAGSSIPLGLDATLRKVGDELEVQASTTVDHRELGMTWSPLGMMRTPSRLLVTGRLTPATRAQ
jgi:polyisoprenoid-binding protein YceI